MRDSLGNKLNAAFMDWQRKLHPTFIEIALAYKRSMLGLADLQREATQALKDSGSTPDIRTQVARTVEMRGKKLDDEFEKSLLEAERKHGPLSPSPLCYPHLTVLSKNVPVEEREQRGLAEFLHWERHHESLEKAEEADSHGDLKAWDRIARTARDFRTIFFKKGPIKPFQGGSYHQDIFGWGVSFESGMEKLSAEELASFFDNVCPCESIHDARALRKQLARLRKDLEAAARKS